MLVQPIKELLFGLLLVVAGAVLAYVIPQVVIMWRASFGTGNGSASVVPLLIGPICGLLLVVSGLVIGYRGYRQTDTEAPAQPIARPAIRESRSA